jgi:GTPase KRas
MGDGFLLVFSVVSRESLREAFIIYEQIRRIKDGKIIPMILVANHCDRVHEREVSREGTIFHD